MGHSFFDVADHPTFAMLCGFSGIHRVWEKQNDVGHAA